MKHLKFFESTTSDIKKGDIFVVDLVYKYCICEVVGKSRPRWDTRTGVSRFEGFYLTGERCEPFIEENHTILSKITIKDGEFNPDGSTIVVKAYRKATKEERELYKQFKKNYSKILIQKRFGL